MAEGSGCIFCKIAAGEVAATRVLEDEHCVAFEDLHPQAPVHVLVVPRRHLSDLGAAGAGDAPLLGRLLAAAAQVARAKGVDRTGFRLIVNAGRDGGQEVQHLHLHVLGGRPLGRMLAR